MNYKNVIVNKPWGYEYLFYENKFVAIWCLHIKFGEATSLHCHPNKKTGLILLSGEAQLSFLNDMVPMKPLSRHILRPGLFHSTKAISDDVVLLEVETPPNKEDIVRFDDKYGRKLKPIESKVTPMTKEYPMLEGGCQIGDYVLSISTFNFAEDNDSVIAVLRGGLVIDDDVIVGPGDVGKIKCTYSQHIITYVTTAF